MSEPTLLRTPTGLSDRLNDDDELETFSQWQHGPGEQVHIAVAAESHWNKQRMTFTPRKKYDDLEDVLDTCKKAGEDFGFDVSKCTRNDVIQQMQKAQEVYTAKGDKNPVRGAFRHGQAISTTVVPWFSAIPDQNGLSILRAGLTIIFQAVQQREANREKIFEAFRLVPEIIEKAQITREYYPKEERLQENEIALYDVLLEEIPQLIRILLRKHNASLWRRWAKQIPGQEQILIDDSVTKVNKAYADLKNCLDNIAHKKLANIDRKVAENVRESKAVRQTVVSTHVEVGNVSNNLQAHREESKVQMDEVQNKVEATGTDVKDHITRNVNEKGEEIKGGLTAIESKVDELKRQFEMSQNAALGTANAHHATTIQTGIYYIVLEKVYYGGYSQPQIYRSPTPTYQKISTSELLGILDVPYDATNTDLGYILRQSNSFKTDTLGHGRWLMTTRSFKNWLGGGGSDILLVDGHCDQSKMGKTSPLSVFCATFIANVVKLQSTMVLHFFCGQHVTFDDPLRGPHGLLRSMIYQLLLYPNTHEPNLEMLSQQKLYDDLRGHELDALRHLFQQLVQQIPRDTLVFCIIDGLSEYETRMNNSTEDLRLVVDGLQSIARDQNRTGPTFKVLMTSANKSIEIWKQIPPQERVSLRAGNVYSGPISEQAFFDDISRAKASIETAGPPLQGLPWIESNFQPAQASLDMSRLRIEGAPTSEPLPWATPQRVQTLIDSESFNSPVPRQWAPAQPPPESHFYRCG
ncbi:hypothetical protein EG329_002899 [Mollisiaceae sp. DMI_Dod_QoI]|nr:hypothetical protein EG329_002899 [Helotiales sp. DMI_Dod_QoI]